MRKFSDDDKKVSEFAERIPYGVHEVLIGLVENGETDKGQEYIEIAVIGPNDAEETARFWFTSDAACNISFNRLREIYVHNAPDKAKDKARETFDKTTNTDDIVELMNEKLAGKGKCWLSKYPSPDRTYEAADGSIRKSIDKNLTGWKPKERPELLPKENSDPEKDALNALEGAEPASKEAADNIPEAW